MKVSCERSLLLSAVSATQKAISVKSTIPALEGVLVRAVGSSLELTGYDLEIGIICTTPADVAKEGVQVVDARMFGEILRKADGETVEIEVEDGRMMHINCGRASFSIAVQSPEEYPQLPTVEQQQLLSLSQLTLKSMIRQTVFAVSQSDTKPVHTGALFEVVDGVLCVVGVDGYRLALRKEKIDAPDMRFIVPGKTLLEVLRLLKDGEEDRVTLICSKKHIRFELDNLLILSRLLEGEFLQYQTAIPASGDVQAVVDVRGLMQCVERASLLISEKMKSPVKLTVMPPIIQVHCATSLGTVDDSLEAISTRGHIEMGFNNRYLLDALKACECEQVSLEMNTPLTPCVIRPLEGDAFTFLVLPVRLKHSGEG